jgi:hypothetical protein
LVWYPWIAGVIGFCPAYKLIDLNTRLRTNPEQIEYAGCQLIRALTHSSQNDNQGNEPGNKPGNKKGHLYQQMPCSSFTTLYISSVCRLYRTKRELLAP